MTEQPGQVLPDWLDVSRETSARLDQFVSLVEKWNPAINLVSRKSLAELRQRHLFDSAQIFPLIPPQSRHLVDLGSGGGFPGLVLAILAHEGLPSLQVTLVEADRRKATFLAEVVRQLGLRCTVLAERIESLAPQHADVLTARALAPLVSLCAHAQRHLQPEGLALFPKGAQVEAELAEAGAVWAFAETRFASKTDPDAVLLAIRDLRHV